MPELKELGLLVAYLHEIEATSGMNSSQGKTALRSRTSLVLDQFVLICTPQMCPYSLPSPLASSAYGIFQARIPGWVAISSSRGSS